MLYNDLKEWGLTFEFTPYEGSSYIFPNGEFLNLNQEKNWEKVDLKNVIAHTFFDEFIIKVFDRKLKNISFKTQPKFIIQRKILQFTDNTIVLNDGQPYKFNNCYIDLPKTEITARQWNSLLLWLDRLCLNNKSKELSVAIDTNVLTLNINEYISDDLLKIIKRFYSQNKGDN